MLKGYGSITDDMAFFDTLPERARSAVDSIRAAFGPPPTKENVPGAFYGSNPEAQEMFNLIEARIEDARGMAAERGDRPSLEDYRQACVAFGETEQGQAEISRLQEQYPDFRWNERSYSNLSGQDRAGNGHNLSGFALSEPQKRAMSDLMNLDSDGAIGDFYTNIDFTGANLKNAYVDPATSFNEEIARAGNLDGLTFNNMSADDPAFVFGAGNYTNIKMTNIQGGQIVFGNGSHVDGLTIEGTSATVTIGDRARLSDVKPTNGFSMMLLSMGEGSLLSNADLSNATISQASEFGQGTTLQSVTFGSNVSGVDFEGVTFNKAVFNGSNLSDTSFAGATLNGVAFNDIDPTALDLSGVQRMNGVTVNGKQVSSAMDLEMMQLAGGVTIPTWSPTLYTPAPSAPSQAANTSVTTQLAEASTTNSLAQSARAKEIADVSLAKFGDDPIAAARALAAQLGIVGGASVNLSDVGLTTKVASLERTVPEHEQASGANMSRSASGNA